MAEPFYGEGTPPLNPAVLREKLPLALPAEGQFTTGGSNGNLMALAIARHRAFPKLKQAGLFQQPRLIAFVSAESHYSFDKAVQLLGIGSDNLWKVPADADGKMDVSALKDLIS